MTAYHLFGYFHYYPDGGLSDYLGSTNNIEDTRALTKDQMCDIYEIVIEKDGKLELIQYGYGYYINRDNQRIEWQSI